jgi:hypothetical protein
MAEIPISSGNLTEIVEKPESLGSDTPDMKRMWGFIKILPHT